MTIAVDRRSLLAAATAAMAAGSTRSVSAGQSAVRGASWRFYRSGSDQPAPVYTDPDLAVNAGTAIMSNERGLLPRIYLDPAITYRATLSDTTGRVLATLDPVPIAILRGRQDTSASTVIVSGAIGDGRLHLLSERFATLAQAKAVFPAATTLSDSICGAAIQSAIDRAATRGRAQQARARVFLPAGRYPLSQPLVLPDGVVLEGEGRELTYIDNQNSPLAAPLIVNDPTGIARVTVRGLSLHGGTHGIKLDVRDYVDGLSIDDVSFQLQTDKNVECNKLLQMAVFRDCTFGIAPFGVFVAAWTANVVSFEGCSFENHTHTHLHLRGAECVNVTGGRFEGGVVFDTSRATIDVTAAAAVNFTGVYFENTHPVLLRERNSRNGVRFDGCHFTGTTGPAGMVGYRFDTDGIVTFGSNDWNRVAQAPARVALNGVNERLITDGRIYLARSATFHDIRSEQVILTSTDRCEILVVRRDGQGSATLRLTGTLHVEIERMAGGKIDSYRYAVSAVAPAGSVTLRVEPYDDGALAVTVSKERNDAAVARLAGLPGGAVRLRWSFDGSVEGITADSSALLLVDFGGLVARG